MYTMHCIVYYSYKYLLQMELHHGRGRFKSASLQNTQVSFSNYEYVDPKTANGDSMQTWMHAGMVDCQGCMIVKLS